jgi:hypothetical protein
MRRVHAFELEDQTWFPAAIRDLATDYLHFFQTTFALHRPAAALLGPALEASGATAVVDLCSGGGGPLLVVQRDLAAGGRHVRATLTDRFPNAQAFAHVARESGGALTYVEAPVDARAVPQALAGFRTVFNAFHHFAPADAVAVLRDAAIHGQPIAVFELSNRAAYTLVPLLFTPLYVWLATPFIRPFRWRRLLWTYLVPLVPLTCWWDGIVSQLRAYTPSELEDLARCTGVADYTWRAGQVRIGRTPGMMTYLIGIPNAMLTAES